MLVFRKFILIIAALVAGMAAGSLIMHGIYALFGLDINEIFAENSIASSPFENNLIKIGFGLSHLISFSLVSVCIIQYFSKKMWREYTGLNRSFKWGWLANLMLLLLLTYPVMSGLSELIHLFPLPEWAQKADRAQMAALQNVLRMDTMGEYVLTLITAAVIPGLGEEMFFRGIIQKELSHKIQPVTAVLITALIFALFHLDFSGFLPKFIIGLVLGYAYHLTQNLIYPILLHMANNGFQISILYFSKWELQQLAQKELEMNVIFASACFLPLVAVQIYLLNKSIRHGSNP